MVDTASDLPSGDCILFATADWDEAYWTNKQHSASELAKEGWRVLYVESVGLRSPKMGSGRDWSRLWRRLKLGTKALVFGSPERGRNIWVLSPLLIPAAHHWPVVGRINRSLLNFMISRFVRNRAFVRPVVWTYHPFMLSAIESISHGPILYHCVDDLAAVPGVDAEVFRKAENELLHKCQVVVATAMPLADRCSAINPNTHFLPNVVDAEHFARAMEPGVLPADLAGIPEPRLVYHGVLSDFKVDFPLLLEAARMRPDWHWILIGEQREGQKSKVLEQLAVLPNVHLLGYRRYSELPDYLRGMQVGLLPTVLNPYTRSMFPMKYFEYLAAGLRVVSTPLDFTKQHMEGLEKGGTALEFIDALSHQLKRGRLNSDEVSKWVGENTWSARTLKMLQFLRNL